MPDHRVVYSQQAEQYEQIVSQLDYQNNILRALTEIHPLEGCKVVELGAGTGRVTRILAPLVDAIWAFDASLNAVFDDLNTVTCYTVGSCQRLIICRPIAPRIGARRQEHETVGRQDYDLYTE